MKKLLAVAALFVCSLWLASPAAANDIVSNGGFETGDFTGWTLSDGGALSGVFYGVDNFDANSGDFGAALGYVSSTFTLSQTLTTLPGETLVVSFAVAEDLRGGDGSEIGSNNTFVVTLNGQTLLTLDNPTTNVGNWAIYTFELNATAGSEVLAFTSENDLDFWSLDDVSVLAPEPGALYLLGTGLLGLAGIYRRRILG